jgi:hypothetical protein
MGATKRVYGGGKSKWQNGNEIIGRATATKRAMATATAKRVAGNEEGNMMARAA